MSVSVIALRYGPIVAPFLPVDQAQALVLARCRLLASEPVALAEATGRITAESARAQVDLPPFPSSAMDGYAVRAADVPGVLALVGRIAAGHPAERALAEGEAMEISTGGVVPEGADTVAPVEIVTVHDDTVHVPDPLEPGTHVRPPAGHARSGDDVVPPGVRPAPTQLASLAAPEDPEVSEARILGGGVFRARLGLVPLAAALL